MLYTLSSHCTTLCLYCRCDNPGAAFFSPRTADVTFLILQTFSSHHRPYPITFTSYYRCNPDGTAHFLFCHHYYDFTDTADFLLTSHTLSYYCRYSNSCPVHSLFTLHNLLLILQMQASWYCTLSLLVLQM